MAKIASSPDLEALASGLRSWWLQEAEDWDVAVMGGGPQQQLPGGDDLWDDMPKVDSKAIARSSPIFVLHLGVPLDTKLIRPGGYSSLDEAIADLVPKMATIAAGRKSGNS